MQMQNPKTTIAGYIGMLGTLLVIVGSLKPASSWGQALLQIGAVLSGGGASVGAISAQDGSH